MRSRRTSLGLGALVALVCALLATPAAALTPEEEATSVRLMKEGIAARDRGDLETAERSFRAAHGIANLPSSGYALASVLERRGKLVEALTVAQAVQRMTPAETWTSASTDGYRQAGPLAASLERRVATMTVVVAGADDASVRVKLDGQLLKPPVLGVPRLVDPGHHELELTREGYAPAASSLDLREGEQRRVEPAFTPGSPSSTAGGASDASPSDEDETEIRGMLVGGIVLAGLGLGGVGAGVAFGLASQSKVDEISPRCPGGYCPPALYGELDTAESRATFANVFLIGGGVLAAAGATLIVVDLASDEEETTEAARLDLGPGFVRYERPF